MALSNAAASAMLVRLHDGKIASLPRMPESVFTTSSMVRFEARG
jgi:hypothetical protein